MPRETGTIPPPRAARRLYAMYLLLVATGIALAAAAAPGDAVIGRWKTVDEATGAPRSIVELHLREGKLRVRGFVLLFFRTETWIRAGE